MIVGIDEVGRGSWAGPLCVVAVAWPYDAKVRGLNDSKLVSLKNRAPMAYKVKELAGDVGIGWVNSQIIDMLGLTVSLQMAARIATKQLSVPIDEIIIDGNLMLLDDPRAQTVIKADSTIPAVMAASIVAKVARDSYMHALDRYLGQYQFSRHVGYGTALHKALLAEFGPSTQHRMSFAPLKGLAA